MFQGRIFKFFLLCLESVRFAGKIEFCFSNPINREVRSEGGRGGQPRPWDLLIMPMVWRPPEVVQGLEVGRGRQRSAEVGRGRQRSPQVTWGHLRSPELLQRCSNMWRPHESDWRRGGWRDRSYSGILTRITWCTSGQISVTICPFVQQPLCVGIDLVTIY